MKRIKTDEEVKKLIDLYCIDFIDIKDNIDQDKARRIRYLRVNLECSYRRVAELYHNAFGKIWSPADNQMAGIDLCYIASLYHGEDFTNYPWN